jgi:hypothetical protein
VKPILYQCVAATRAKRENSANSQKGRLRQLPGEFRQAQFATSLVGCRGRCRDVSRLSDHSTPAAATNEFRGNNRGAPALDPLECNADTERSDLGLQLSAYYFVMTGSFRVSFRTSHARQRIYTFILPAFGKDRIRFIDPAFRIFDDSHYAAGIPQKIRRAIQLGPSYYLWNLPRYIAQRRGVGLSCWDVGALINPLREFRSKSPQGFLLPPGFPDALQRLAEAGVRLTLPRARLEALVNLWWTTRDVPGEIVEFGSYRGATALTLALLGHIHNIRRLTVLLDTFTGTPATNRYDASRSAGEFTPPTNQVGVIRQQAAALGILDQIEIHQGLFAESIRMLQSRNLRFAFVHIDANLYQSTLEACAFALPRISAGGAVVFDDYNGPCDLGARLAIDQSLAGKGVKPLPLVWSSAYVRL